MIYVHPRTKAHVTSITGWPFGVVFAVLNGQKNGFILGKQYCDLVLLTEIDILTKIKFYKLSKKSKSKLFFNCRLQFVISANEVVRVISLNEMLFFVRRKSKLIRSIKDKFVL